MFLQCILEQIIMTKDDQDFIMKKMKLSHNICEIYFLHVREDQSIGLGPNFHEPRFYTGPYRDPLGMYVHPVFNSIV